MPAQRPGRRCPFHVHPADPPGARSLRGLGTPPRRTEAAPSSPRCPLGRFRRPRVRGSSRPHRPSAGPATTRCQGSHTRRRRRRYRAGCRHQSLARQRGLCLEASALEYRAGRRAVGATGAGSAARRIRQPDSTPPSGCRDPAAHTAPGAGALGARRSARQTAAGTGTTSANFTVSMNCRKRASLPSRISQTWTAGRSSVFPVALPVPV
jgi:hypothetical protein